MVHRAGYTSHYILYKIYLKINLLLKLEYVVVAEEKYNCKHNRENI